MRTPHEVHKSPKIQNELFSKYLQRAINLRKKNKQRVKYNVGQMVRVQYKRGRFARSYDEQAGSQRYRIQSIDSKSRQYPLYTLEDERGKKLKGGAFLQSQLIPINLGEKYRGTVVKRFRKNKHNYVRMSFKGYKSPEWDEDIPVK